MGSGYRTFTAGEVLTASNVQNYLQDQAVMVFAGTAARSSAIGTANFEEGMLTYLTDVDKLQVYTGAAFADVYPPAATSQGMTLINTTSFSGVASQAVPTVFSATYENYKIIVTFSAVSADGAIFMKLRSGATDSSTGYSTGNPGLTETGVAQNQYEAGITSGFRINTIDNTATADYYSNSIDLYKPFLTNRSSMSLTGVGVNTSGTFFGFAGGGQHTVASSYDGINIIASAGNISGKVSVYGYNL